jgi:hypothetical protein
MVYLNPGDNAEVDKLLEELRTECDEGDPFFVDFNKKRKRKLKALASSQGGEGGAREAREEATKRKGGVSPRWLGYATVAIVGPVVTLLLVMLLASRKPATGEAARVEERSQVAPAHPTASPSEATAGPAASPLMFSTAAPSADVAPRRTTAPKATPGAASPPPRSKRQIAAEIDPYVPSPSPEPTQPTQPASEPNAGHESKPAVPSEFFD